MLYLAPSALDDPSDRWFPITALVSARTDGNKLPVVALAAALRDYGARQLCSATAMSLPRCC